MPLFGASLFMLPLLGSALASSIPSIEPRPLALNEANAALTPLDLRLPPIRIPAPAAAAPPVANPPAPVVSPPPRAELAAMIDSNSEAATDNGAARIAVGWRREALREAYSHLGTIYRWGGEEPNGFDCSGFVKYVMEGLGFQLPRTARAMHRAVPAISATELLPGDLVFFRGPDHVGIYVGSGQFIHASSGFKQVTISALEHNAYRRRYIGAGRIAE